MMRWRSVLGACFGILGVATLLWSQTSQVVAVRAGRCQPEIDGGIDGPQARPGGVHAVAGRGCDPHFGTEATITDLGPDIAQSGNGKDAGTIRRFVHGQTAVAGGSDDQHAQSGQSANDAWIG